MAVFKEELVSAAPMRDDVGEAAFALRLTEFDQRHYLKLIRARGETIRRVVTELRSVVGLTSALDAGCGVGFFSQILQECGLDVRGFDGRTENILEAQRRFPAIAF